MGSPARLTGISAAAVLGHGEAAGGESSRSEARTESRSPDYSAGWDGAAGGRD